MLSIAICDDNIPITGKIETLLEKIAKQNNIHFEICVFWDGKELTKEVEKGKRFDVIYLDIKMKKEDGISAAKHIREYDKNAYIIYITSYENYMRSSFEVRAFRFLLKPINKNEFIKSFIDAFKEISYDDYYFRYSYKRINYKILIRDILYFESQKRKINIITEENVYELYGQLNDIDKKLERTNCVFLRVHQSYLVNYKHVFSQAYDFVTMSDSKQISISEDRRKLISEVYCMMGDALYVN